MDDASSAPTARAAKSLLDFRTPGPRRPMDWKYSLREYLLLALLPIFFFGAGRDLVGKDSWWQTLAGIAMFVLMVAVLGLYLRWLVRPIDPVAKVELAEYYESMRWKNIWRDMRELGADIRTAWSERRRRRRSRP